MGQTLVRQASHTQTSFATVQGPKLCCSAMIVSESRVCGGHRGSPSPTTLKMTEELRVEINRVLICMLPKPNIVKEEAKALKELRQDIDSHTYSGKRGGLGSMR